MLHGCRRMQRAARTPCSGSSASTSRHSCFPSANFLKISGNLSHGPHTRFTVGARSFPAAALKFPVRRHMPALPHHPAPFRQQILHRKPVLRPAPRHTRHRQRLLPRRKIFPHRIISDPGMGEKPPPAHPLPLPHLRRRANRRNHHLPCPHSSESWPLNNPPFAAPANIVNLEIIPLLVPSLPLAPFLPPALQDSSTVYDNAGEVPILLERTT